MPAEMRRRKLPRVVRRFLRYMDLLNHPFHSTFLVDAPRRVFPPPATECHNRIAIRASPRIPGVSLGGQACLSIFFERAEVSSFRPVITGNPSGLLCLIESLPGKTGSTYPVFSVEIRNSGELAAVKKGTRTPDTELEKKRNK